MLQGWEAARDHARSAVETDNRLRRWLPGPGLAQGPPAGLLYRCTLGNIDLTAPLGGWAVLAPLMLRSRFVVIQQTLHYVGLGVHDRPANRCM